MVHKNIILLLVLVLAFQPVTTAFAGCMQMDASEHDMQIDMHLDNLSMHHSAINNTNDGKKQNGCFTDCKCAGMCLNSCSILSIISVENLLAYDRSSRDYSTTRSFSLAGYNFLLLRPPSLIS